MNADGTGRQLIDASGWGSQWSPKRNEIAYTVNEQRRAELVVYDVAKQQRRTLPLENAYSQIYWGLTWSPDGKWICFKGNLTGGSGNRRRLHRGREEGLQSHRAEHHAARDRQRRHDDRLGRAEQRDSRLDAIEERPQSRLYLFDFAGGKKPKLFPGIPADLE